MNYITRSLHLAWGALAWAGFGAAVLFALIATIFVPGKALRHRLAALASKGVFVMPRIKVEVSGMHNLPADSCIVVANHASYIDGVLLKGYLPARFSFVIKGEMRDNALVHFVLRRSGAKFVERNEHSGSARDARQIVKAAQDGESLAFFPEGTFRQEPGVARFLPGAFVAAIRGKLPVVPIAISGTREMLPSGQFWPRPNTLKVDILPAISPGDPDFSDSRALAKASRMRVLDALDEPDLVPQSATPDEGASN